LVSSSDETLPEARVAAASVRVQRKGLELELGAAPPGFAPMLPVKAAAPAMRERRVKELGFISYGKLTGIFVLAPSFTVVYTRQPTFDHPKYRGCFFRRLWLTKRQLRQTRDKPTQNS
jgi:hypothetical protein